MTDGEPSGADRGSRLGPGPRGREDQPPHGREHQPPQGPGGPRLMERVHAAARVRHLARSTERLYTHWVRRFILHHGKRHPLSMGEREVKAFLTDLAVRGHVSASTQNQALAALLFLYGAVLDRPLDRIEGVVRARRPRRLPVVLDREEVERVMQHFQGESWMVAMLLYGAGMRLMEALRLRVKDVDFKRRELLIREAKGNKDRITVLPTALVAPLSLHLAAWRLHHAEEDSQGRGRVRLPGALDRKYPSAEIGRAHV